MLQGRRKWGGGGQRRLLPYPMVFPPTSPLYLVVLHNMVTDLFVDYHSYYDCSILVTYTPRDLCPCSHLCCLAVGMLVGLECDPRGPGCCPCRGSHPNLDGW